MDELLDRMIASGYEFIETAYKLMESCRQKSNKRFSQSRLVISFYLRRAVEITESFFILLKENRLADSGVLLRSFWEMGINTDFIFTNPKTKEINAIKFLLNEPRGKIALLKNNMDEYKANGLDVEEILKKKEAQYRELKDTFSSQHNHTDWNWPRIWERAKNSKYWVIKQAYNQVYAYDCNIEHHDILFGENYVNCDNCEPSKDIKNVSLLRPEVNLIMCRSILLVIMKVFNEEFDLKWADILKQLGKKQDQEYEEMKKKDAESNL